MAKIGSNILVLVFLVAMAAMSATQVKALGVEIGGKSEIQDVKSNKEVQEMGKFCVGEYNKKNNGEKLTFTEVVKADKQVVAGLKYYLRISATTSGGATKTFDAAVMVKPRARDKEMVTFAPSLLAK